MVLAAAAQEGAVLTLPADFLREDKAHHIPIERHRSGEVVDEEVHRPDAGDLERLRQEDAVDVVRGRQGFDVAIASRGTAAADQRLVDLLVLRNVRLRGHLGQ